MWIPTIIASIVMFLTVIMLIVLEKTKKIKHNTRIYRIVVFMGSYVPFLTISGNFAYVKTDTLKETILVTSAMWVCIIVWILYLQIGVKHRYSYNSISYRYFKFLFYI